MSNYKLHIASLPMRDEPAHESTRELVCMRVVDNRVVVLNAEDGRGTVVPIVLDIDRAEMLYSWLAAWMFGPADKRLAPLPTDQQAVPGVSGANDDSAPRARSRAVVQECPVCGNPLQLQEHWPHGRYCSVCRRGFH